MNTSPVTQSYIEEFPGRGIPLDQLEQFVERARTAGAPDRARLHVEDTPFAGIISPLPFGGTRARITWTCQFNGEIADPEPDGADEDVKGCPDA